MTDVFQSEKRCRVCGELWVLPCRSRLTGRPLSALKHDQASRGADGTQTDSRWLSGASEAKALRLLGKKTVSNAFESE